MAELTYDCAIFISTRSHVLSLPYSSDPGGNRNSRYRVVDISVQVLGQPSLVSAIQESLEDALSALTSLQFGPFHSDACLHIMVLYTIYQEQTPCKWLHNSLKQLPHPLPLVSTFHSRGPSRVKGSYPPSFCTVLILFTCGIINVYSTVILLISTSW